MNRRRNPNRSSDRTSWSYGTLLDWHIQQGQKERRWTLEEFAGKIGLRGTRTLFDYRNDREPPPEERQSKIEHTLFGEGADQPAHVKHSEWAELRRAYERAKADGSTISDPDTHEGPAPEPPPEGPKLYLKLDRDGHYARDNYVHCDLHFPRNRAQQVLLVWLDAAFHAVEAVVPRLKTVQIEVEPTDDLVPEEIFAQRGAEKLANDIEIRWLGRRNYINCWEVTLPVRGRSLHGLNAVVEEPALFALHGARPGAKCRLKVFADSAKDFIVRTGTGSDPARTRKQAIMERLAMTEIGDPSDSGRILLIDAENEVAEA